MPTRIIPVLRSKFNRKNCSPHLSMWKLARTSSFFNSSCACWTFPFVAELCMISIQMRVKDLTLDFFGSLLLIHSSLPEKGLRLCGKELNYQRNGTRQRGSWIVWKHTSSASMPCANSWSQHAWESGKKFVSRAFGTFANSPVHKQTIVES